MAPDLVLAFSFGQGTKFLTPPEPFLFFTHRRLLGLLSIVNTVLCSGPAWIF